MTKQESFKKRIRARMAATGEKYGAARRALLEKTARDEAAAAVAGRTWAAAPEASDDAVRAATGSDWDTWVAVIEAGPHADDGHTAVAAWLRKAHHLDMWWSQQVTGGWERITGRRLPGQMPDGTFSANKSRTIDVEPTVLRDLLLDERARDDLFAGEHSTLVSRPDAKAMRIAMVEGVATISVTAKADGRSAVSIQHNKLPSSDKIAAWKQYWTEWLDTIDGVEQATG